MNLKLRYVPDPILKQISTPVEKIDKELLSFMDKMLEAMYDKDGIGLAGIQVGFPKRIITLDLRDKNSDSDDEIKNRNPKFLINPEIVWCSENQTPLEEGCLSVPNQRAIVNRPQKIKVKYIDRKGEEKLLEADNLLSKCIQHEMDHLNGKLFIDYLSKLKRDSLVNKVKKMEKRGDLD